MHRMLRKSQILAWLLSLVLVASFFAGVPGAEIASADVISDVVAQAQEVHDYLAMDPTGRAAVRIARDNLGSLTGEEDCWNDEDEDEDHVFNLLCTDAVKKKFGGEQAAESAIVGFVKGVGSLYYSEDSATLKSNLEAFKNAYRENFRLLFGDDFTMEEFYNFLLEAKNQAPYVLPDVDDLAELARGNFEDARPVFIQWSKNALSEALKTYPTFNNRLSAIGWSIDALVDAHDAVSDVVDPGYTGEKALLKAYVRSQTKFIYNGQEVKTGDTIYLQKGDTISLGSSLAVLGFNVAGVVLNWKSDDLSGSNVLVIDGKTLKANATGTACLTAYNKNPENDWAFWCKIEVVEGAKEVEVPSSGVLDNLSLPTGNVSVALKQGDAQLEIAPGTFTGAAKVTFKTIDKATDTRLPGESASAITQVFEIKIENVTLAKPVTLRLPAPTAGERARVFKLNEATKRWVNLGGTLHDGYVEVSVSSFSLFTTANAPASPTASPAGGSYTGNVQVTLSAESGATILYGVNAAPQTVYTSPITLTSSGTIRAIAVKNALTSDEVSFTYTITPSGGGGGGTAPPPTTPTAPSTPSEAVQTVTNVVQQVTSGQVTPTQAAQTIVSTVTAMKAEQITAEVKATVNTAITAVITNAGTITASKLQTTTTETKAVVTVPAASVTEQLAQVTALASTLQAAAEKAGVAVEKQVVIVPPPAAAGKAEVAVQVPAEAVQAITNAGANLVVKANETALSIPPQALATPSGSTVQISSKALTGAEAAALTASLPATAMEKMSAASQVVELNVSVSTAAGQSAVTSFSKPVKVLFTYDPAKVSRPELLGVYTYNEATQKWDFVGGKVDRNNNTVSAETRHFSKYAAMVYEKSFADIAGYWAKADIEVMAAKHVVKGVTDTTFEPERQVTRAEFAALVARSLGLTYNELQTVTFQDVTPDKWFYKEVAATVAAGLIKGRSDVEFAPNDKITRQEMAVLITRALNARGKGVSLTAAQVNEKLAAFSDQSEIASWARAEVACAAEVGLVKGRTATTFVPLANASRAEGTVIIKRMLERLEE